MAIPNREIKPMMAGILMIPDVIHMLMTPPMIARGRFNMMIPDSGMLWNSLNNSRKINKMDIREVKNKVREAACSLSN